PPTTVLHAIHPPLHAYTQVNRGKFGGAISPNHAFLHSKHMTPTSCVTLTPILNALAYPHSHPDTLTRTGITAHNKKSTPPASQTHPHTAVLGRVVGERGDLRWGKVGDSRSAKRGVHQPLIRLGHTPRKVGTLVTSNALQIDDGNSPPVCSLRHCL